MLIIGTTYFLQGFRNYAFGDGIIWFFSDVFDLDPATKNNDLIPLKYQNKQPPQMQQPSALMGLAMSDVIADAMVVRQAREAGEAGGANLQAFCWVLSSVGGIIGRPFAGYINGKDGKGSRILLGVVYSISSLLGCTISLLHAEQKCTDPSWSIARFTRQIMRLIKSIFGNKLVWLPMAWIILNQAIVPDVSAAMNFWKRSVINVGADKKAYIDTVGDVFSICGIVLYTNFFMIGSQTVINTLYSFQGMPFFVLAAQLCPHDIEATFYATMMSIGNIGGNIGTMFGGYLLEELHIVRINEHFDKNTTIALGSTQQQEEEYDFTNLVLVLWIRVGAMAVSALFVFAMVPNVPEVKSDDDSGEAKKVLDSEEICDGGGENVQLVRKRAGSAVDENYSALTENDVDEDFDA
ncbi:hypothetical protein HK100_012896 [Physocladia obscura]|uniref:Uncharacterized protein n=1 Tax=Physocladia obscura TaxID=109957 RepID=A0AAD5T1W6_9FUNG|nr:hypothetical protein HK100_012896 [Physocladia obscura]